MQLMCTPTDNVIFKNKHEPIFKLKLSFMSTMHIFSGNMICRWGRLPILSVGNSFGLVVLSCTVQHI